MELNQTKSPNSIETVAEGIGRIILLSRRIDLHVRFLLQSYSTGCIGFRPISFAFSIK